MSKKDKSKNPSLLKRLVPYMGNKKALLPLSMVLSGLSSVLNLLPFVFIWLIAREIFSNPGGINMTSVNHYAWLALGTSVLAIAIYFIGLSTSHLCAFHVEAQMRRVAMKKVINMPLGFFSKNSSGKVRKLIDDNASQTHTYLAHQMLDLAGSVVAPLVLLVMMVVVDWRMGLASLVPLLLGFVSMSFMMSAEGKEFRKKYMDYMEDMSSEAVEYVRGIPVVKTFGQSVHSFKRFVDSIIKYKEVAYSYTVLWAKPMSFYTIIMQSVAFFLVPLAVILIGRGDNLALTLTNFIFYILVAPNFTLLFMRIAYMQNYGQITKVVLDRFDEILDYPEMIFKEDGPVPEKNTIEFKNVTFTYPGSENKAVDGISFTVNQGETVALVGASGGGKTTVARLAARFWDAESGEILIGGEDIKNIPRDKLMEKIAFVFQNTKLFKTSLRENVTYGKADATEEEINTALELSQSKEIIDSLPGGLDTVIGSKGTYLSGGEQQRIALARAFLKDSPIVLLDEATAFADPENEHLIQGAIKRLSKGKTTIMIAHRLTSVVDADKIIVMENGGIAQQGSHDQLVAQEGLYKTMWNEYKQSVEWRIA